MENINNCEEIEEIEEIKNIENIENIEEENNNITNNVGYDYIFVNKPKNKTVFNTLLDNSNELINKIKKYI